MQRFIPTCVGNTSDIAAGVMPIAVHPHVRGEHGRAVRCGVAFAGSSPRAWGTHSATGIAYFRRRFIPTCVGNTG